MKTRPIIFQPDMVRAILDGRKSQTRRINGLSKINKNPGDHSKAIVLNDGTWSFWHPGNVDEKWVRNVAYPDGGGFKCPYGVPGDRLWVREKFRIFNSVDECGCCDHCACDRYNGKPVFYADTLCNESKWKPSIHMPRKLSRLTLEVTNIRVERVQDISAMDCISEGIKRNNIPDIHIRAKEDRCRFQRLWDKMHKKQGFGWSENPWVWVVEFKVIEP